MALLRPPLLLTAGALAAPGFKAGVFEPPRAAPELASLQGTDGRALALSQHRGKLVLLTFGFTNCPEACPTTLATLAQARQALGPQGEAVQVVYVTVDPERDDLERIRRYLAAFDPGFVGGTGRPEALAEVRRQYGVVAEKVVSSQGGYAMNHSTSVYLIDRQGRLRAMMPYGHPAEDFVHDLQWLLALK
jgi:protein SCO1/2